MVEWLQRGSGTEVPKILVVDDTIAHLDVLRTLMGRENFNCTIKGFASGAEALEYLAGHTADLILLDVMMPLMDGFDVLKYLKEDPATAEIPVILLSGSHQTPDIVRAFEMGAADYVTKPVITPLLVARIRAILHTYTLRQELRERNSELESTMRLKDELISICSHDLRAPLGTINLICQFLNDSLAGNSDYSQETLIGRIMTQAGLARRLVDNLLDFDRIEEGRLIPTPSFFSVRTLIHACADEQTPNLHARNVHFELTLPDEHALAFADPELVAQVVRNLLGNALKFTHSRVSLAAEVTEGDSSEPGILTIRVADDGAGVPPGEEGRIFEKYTRFGAQAGGSGMGLYITRTIVELHGGAVTVSSKPHEQTEFVATLPRAVDRRRLPELSAYHDRQVVVLAESKTQQQVLERLLLESGLLEVQAQLISASFQQGAVLDPPDLAVVYLEPGGDEAGALTKAMRRTTGRTRWVVVGDVSALEALKAAGAQPYRALAPPINPVALLRAVESVLRNQEADLTLLG